jgi:ArsR family transcriptional regulator, arsenate/arsenite/antimonite-responsive transcriptional repressor
MVEKSERILYTEMMNDLDTVKKLLSKNLPLFNALGDATRQQLLALMMGNHPLSVQELADAMKMSRPTISHHLMVLREAKVVVEHKEGRRIYYKPQLGEYYYTVKDLIDLVDRLTKEDCR